LEQPDCGKRSQAGQEGQRVQPGRVD
jgi:hypothetical protein